MNSFLNSSGFILKSSFINQIVMYILSFLKPDIPGAPHFSEINIIEFLYYFQCLEKKHDINNNDLIKMLLDYYKREKRS